MIIQRLIVLMSSALLAGSVAAADPLSFSAAAERMMQNNPALAQKELQTKVAGLQETRARAAYFPQLDFVQSWTRSNNPVFSFGSLLNQERFTEADFALDRLNHPSPLNDVSSKFQLGWLLYDFGRRESQVESAGSYNRIAQLTEQATKSDLLSELVKRYYAVSLARQQAANAEDQIRSVQSRLEQARDRVDQGIALATDSLSAEVYVARAQQEQIEAENQVHLAGAALLELLGSTSGSEVETDPLKEIPAEERQLDWWLMQMRSNRPEIKIAAVGLEFAGTQVTATRAALLPSLQGYSAYEWHGDSFSYTGNNWTAGVELRWNLFRGFSDSKELAASQLRQKEAIQKQRQTENAVVLQLQSAFFRLSAAQQKVKVAAAAVNQASENRRIYADRYAAGLVSIQDALQAEASLSQTRLMYLMSLYEANVARAELLAAAGLPEFILSGETS